MRTEFQRPAATVAVACLTLLLLLPQGAARAEVSADILLGFNGGTGGQVGFKVAPIRPDLQWGTRISVGYMRRDAGNASEAFAVFTGSTPVTTPEEEATTWSFRLDANYQFKTRSFSELSVFGGLRHARFKAKLDERDSGTALEIESNPWGIGVGIEGDYEFGRTTDLLVVLGVDYYFKASLKGNNGVAYKPGEETDGVSYDAANDAVNQPRLELLALIGLSFRFGE